MENLTKFTCIGILLALVSKGLISGIDPSMAISIASIAALLFGAEKINKSEEIRKTQEAHMKQVEEIKDYYKEQEKDLMEVKSYFASVKIGNHLRAK